MNMKKNMFAILAAGIILACLLSLTGLSTVGNRITQTQENIRHEEQVKTKKYKDSLDKLHSSIQQELDKQKKASPDYIAISYYDIDSKTLLNANGETPLEDNGISNLALEITAAEKIAQKKLSGTDKIIYDSTDFSSKKGYIVKHLKKKREFTVSQLMKLVVTDSDEIAANMLYRRLGGFSSVRNYIDQTYHLDLNTAEDRTSTNDCVQLLKILYKNKSSYCEKIISWMKDEQKSPVPNKVIPSIVVQNEKTNKGDSQKYMVLPAKHPYILVVSSSSSPEQQQRNTALSNNIYALMTKNYPNEN